MRSAECSQCGQNYPQDAGHNCSGEKPEPANENVPRDEKTWRRDYMREYMRRLRAAQKAARVNP